MMVKVRQDAWSHEDDLLLAETVLRHIREGSTQLKAFDEVGDILNRTSAACGFRWNAEVRKKYINAVDLAKRQRKEKKRAEAKLENHIQTLELSHTPNEDYEQETAIQLITPNHKEMNLDDVIHYLEVLKDEKLDSNNGEEREMLEQENTKLIERVHHLETLLKESEEKRRIVEEDYHTFLNIMERARKMTFAPKQEEESNLHTPAFRMQTNPNLEQLIQETNSL